MKEVESFAIAMFCLLFAATSFAGTATKISPRIETGRHTATITDLSVSADGRTIATSSDDKTVRIWSEAGLLVQTIRPAVGDGAGHTVTAVALSADGSTIAYQFSAVRRLEENNREYKVFPVQIYHRPTDHVLATIFRFAPGRISFSPDGKYLGIGTHSLELYRTSDWKLYASTAFRKGLPEKAGWNALAFAPSSSSIAGIINGEIVHLKVDSGDYEKTQLGDTKGCDQQNEYCHIISWLANASKRFMSTKRLKAEHGAKPASLVWSPDGKWMAVGYLDNGSVSVLSAPQWLATELKPKGLTSGFLHSPETMMSLAWAPDSKSLASAGTMATSLLGPTVVRTWKLSGEPSFSDIRTSKESRGLPVQSLAVHRLGTVSSGFVFASGDSIGFISNGDVRLIQPVSGLHRQGTPYVSSDGKTVGFRFRYSWGSPLGERWRFDVSSRKLSKEAEGEVPELHDTIGGAPGMEGAGLLSSKPTLNGVLLAVQGDTTDYSFSPDGDSLFVGSVVGLHRFDRMGNTIWSILVPEEVRGLNVSRDGRFVLAALGDGTLRWYRQSDGTEVLAFYVLNDRRSWVLWTPSGIFDASDGGRGLVVLEMNDGSDAPRRTKPSGPGSPTLNESQITGALGDH